MATGYARGNKALGECDICSLTFKLNDLRKLVVNRQVVNLKVCPDCWTPDHEQLQVGLNRVTDPQALLEPRPYGNPTDMRNIAWGWKPVYAVTSSGQIGNVIVSLS